MKKFHMSIFSLICSSRDLHIHCVCFIYGHIAITLQEHYMVSGLRVLKWSTSYLQATVFALFFDSIH